MLCGNVMSVGVVWQCGVSRYCMAKQCQQMLCGNVMSVGVLW